MSQDNATFKAVFDDLTLPFQKAIEKELARNSQALNFLFKPVSGSEMGKPVTGIPTFEGRYVKLAINAEYPVTYSSMNQFNIEHGDVKNPKKGKNLICGEIGAVDKGFTMSILTSDIQLLKQKGADRNSEVYVNWIKDYWNQIYKGLALSLTNSIYNGAGASAVDPDGNVKPDFYGLATAIGTGTYAGKTTADFGEWKSHVFNLAGATSAERLGYAAADVDTVSELVSVASGRKTSRFYDIINKVRLQIEEMTSDKVVCVMHPAVYDYLWIPSLEANQINAVSRLAVNGNALEVTDDMTKLGNMTIIRENSRVPSANTGGTGTYILPSDTIYFLNPEFVHLEVESSNNFVVTDWEYIPNQYNTLQKSLTSTLIMYVRNRWKQGKLTLPAAVKAELDAVYSV